LTSGPWQNRVLDASHAILDESPGAGTNNYVHAANVAGTHVSFLLSCSGPATCYADAWSTYQVDTVDVTITDVFAPAAGTPSGVLKAQSKLVGDVAISYPATDNGSGLYRTVLYDGNDVISRSIVNTNSGHCGEIVAARTFDRAVPCLLSATADATLDTTKLADGNHSIEVALEDAAGNRTTVYGPVTKLIGNHPPVNTGLPRPATDSAFSNAHVGSAIAFNDGGTWTGPSLSMSYAWLRCDANGNACEQIPGATGLAYTPTFDDVGHTLKLASTATNVADTVTVYSAKSGLVTAPKDLGGINDKPNTGTEDPKDKPGNIVTLPGLTTNNVTNNNTHTFIGRIAGEQAGAACPGDKATLKFQHVTGGQLRLGYGKASTAQLELTCTTTGKAIADAKLEIATKTGAAAAVASDVTTDGAGHATIRLAKGASRGITVGYRMYSDDTLARATATLKVLVKGNVALKADKKRLRNGQAVALRGTLAGGHVPKRGVTLAVQWKDGKRWRPFAQIKTNKKGAFAYAYKFTRTNRTIKYQLRVQVTKGQVDYPFVPTASKPVKVTVAP
jgi:hypothetical protein